MESGTKYQPITLVGMGDHPMAMLPECKLLIEKHVVFSGGKRHYELVKEELPEHHVWISIEGKMEEVISKYKAQIQPVLIFTSGDPLFYGFANTLSRLMPEQRFSVIPWFSSLQRLCHKTNQNYSSLKSITLHGRSWKALDEALIKGNDLIGILTDQLKGPSQIASRLLEYGFDEYEMIIGEKLDGENEQISTLSLNDAMCRESEVLNCVLLRKKHTVYRSLSPDDFDFVTLPDRPGMITKKPFRALVIQFMVLEKRTSLWDIGACTGSISIECKKVRPSLDITAFEIRPECKEIIEENARKFATPGIEVVIGDFFEHDLDSFSAPDAVFIGGHGNRLAEMIHYIDNYLLPDGVIVMNSVKKESAEIFRSVGKALKYDLQDTMTVTINEYNTIHILVATKKK